MGPFSYYLGILLGNWYIFVLSVLAFSLMLSNSLLSFLAIFAAPVSGVSWSNSNLPADQYLN